ncbi:MAG TPA: PAS domain S-box protein, partial [Longimicrobiaceae bacterium]|nr:PAS domain S-box protein [Longimicrobiaceae bacterium]
MHVRAESPDQADEGVPGWTSWLPAVLVVVSLIALLLVPLLLGRRISALREEIARVAEPARGDLIRIDHHFSREIAALRGYLLTDEEEFLDRYRAARADEARAFEDLRARVERLGSEAEASVDSVHALHSGWHAADAAILRGGLSRAELLDRMRRQEADHEEVLAALERADRAISRAVAERREQIQSIQRLEAVLIALLVLLALASALLVARLGRRLRTLALGLERRVQEEAALGRVARGLTIAPSTEEMLQRVAESALRVIRAESAHVERINFDRNEVEVAAVAGERGPAAGVRLPYPGSLAEEVIKSGKPEIVTIAEIAEQERPIARQLEASCGGCAALVLPLVSEGDALGVLMLLREAEDSAFLSEEVARLRTLSDLAAATLRRALLVEEVTRRQRKLEESEQRFRSLAENATEAIVTIDAEDRIHFANPGAEKVFGYTIEQMLRFPFSTLMPERMRERHRSGLKRYAATRARHIPWDGIDLPGLTKEGHEVPLEITFSEYERDGKLYFTGVMRDIAERKRAEAERERLLAEEQEARQ